MNITGKTVPWPSLQSFPRGSHSHEFVCKIFLLQQHDRLFPQLLFLIKKFCSLTCSRTFSSPGPCAQPCSWHREEMQSQPHPLESGFSFGCGCPNPHWRAVCILPALQGSSSLHRFSLNTCQGFVNKELQPYEPEATSLSASSIPSSFSLSLASPWSQASHLTYPPIVQKPPRSSSGLPFFKLGPK